MERDTGKPAPMGGGATWRNIALGVMALLGAVTLVALIVILTGANRQRDRALDAQAHSFEVMTLARSLSATMARSEASLGRYVVSGDRSLGQLYFDQWRLAAAQLDRLDHLTHDNLDQQRRVTRLRIAYRSRGNELSLTALSTNYGLNEQAYARYYRAARTGTLATTDAMLDGLIRAERRLLDQRTAAATAWVDRASRIAGILAVFGVLLVLGAIALGWVTVLAMGERAIARAEADAARARADELGEAVAQATSELRVQEAKLRQIQKMEAVGQLTGGIAHDFNNMLAVVLGGLELARRHAGRPAELGRHLDSATEGANRAAALTRRLLAFSREESLKPAPVAAAELITGMSDLLDRTLGDAITLHVLDRAEGWHIYGDRVQLENAILNLAVNARDAMAGRGVMTITTTACQLAEHEIDHCPAGDYVAIAVTDTGHGMTPDIAERVFEPFFTTKEAGKGTGLGLSQIFALVRQLDGEIAIDTAPGRGTTVTLFLPRFAATETVQPMLEPIIVPEPLPEQLRVLIVEDDPRVLAATSGALEELGHVVIPCDDPLAAPAMLHAHDPIDLVISDVLMPRQTGPEMVAVLTQQVPNLAVLFVTGFAGEVNASEFGHRPVLRKPFTLVGLERAIADAMAAGRPAAPDLIAAE